MYHNVRFRNMYSPPHLPIEQRMTGVVWIQTREMQLTRGWLQSPRPQARWRGMR